jgi:hypothetical protein
MEYLHKDLVASGHTILDSIPGNSNKLHYGSEYDEEAELVVINGEGTMHHNKLIAQQYINVLVNAKKLGMKTALVNTVWQEMSLTQEQKEVLRDTYISVREVKSQRELEKDDIHADVHLDLSYFNDVPEKVSPHRELVIGKFFSQSDWRPSGIPTIDIFKHDWDTIVNVLRMTDWFLTGRHHELYAACKARCPSAVLAGNTWKNEGLFETAGVEIQVARGDISHSNLRGFLESCKEHRMEYEKLFNWMEKQPKFSFSNVNFS